MNHLPTDSFIRVQTICIDEKGQFGKRPDDSTNDNIQKGSIKSHEHKFEARSQPGAKNLVIVDFSCCFLSALIMELFVSFTYF